MKIPVDISDIDPQDKRATARRCWLELMNVGGLDGDWWEIASEIDSRGFWEALSDYFEWDDPTRATVHG